MTTSDVAFVLAIVAALLYVAANSPVASRYFPWSRKQVASQPATVAPQEKPYTPWPAPAAEPSFDVSKASEPKFRPFRWGDFRLSMGIKPLDPLKWLELHTSYPSFARLRAARHETYGSRCVQVLPRSDDANQFAALEVARAIAAYLASRYPTMFEVEPVGSERANDDGWSVRKVRRKAMPSYDIAEKTWTLNDLGVEGGDDPMRVAGELVPDDLAILKEEDLTEEERRGYPCGIDKAPKRAHRLVAGSICTAGFWRLDDKIGLCLREIHTRGNVPEFDEKLLNPLDRFFSKLHPSKPVERIDNFFFQIIRDSQKAAIEQMADGSLVPDILNPEADLHQTISGSKKEAAAQAAKELLDPTQLSWNWTINGPEKAFCQSGKGPKADSGVEFESTQAENPGCVVMRAERQTLRRMPRSGAILFTIRTYLTPVENMANEPGVPGRLAHAIRTWPDDVRRSKGADLYAPIVLPYLDAKHQSQLDQGIITDIDSEMRRSRMAFPL